MFTADNELIRARDYGLLGMALNVIGTIISPFIHVSFILNITGILLIALSIKIISDYYGNSIPFKYAIAGLITSIIGYLISLFFILPAFPVRGFGILSLIFAAGLIILTLFLSSIFLYLAYDEISELTGIDEFHTGAVLILIGLILTIILIGFLLMFIGIVFIFIGYNKLPYRAKTKSIDTDFYSNQ